MAKFTVQHQSPSAKDQAYASLKQLLTAGTEISKFDPSAKCEFIDTENKCSIKGSQFKATLQVKEHGSGSEIQIEVDLPFLLMPLKGKIQESLIKMLSKHLT